MTSSPLTDNLTIPVSSPENLRLLRKVAKTGLLNLRIDWGGLPLKPDPKRQKSAFSLRQIADSCAGIEAEFLHAASLVCCEMPWDTLIAFRQEADVVLRFYHLNELEPERHSVCSLNATPAIIWLDTVATIWGVKPKRRRFRPDVVCLRSLLVRSLAGALGCGSVTNPASIFYERHVPQGNPIVDSLLEEDLPYWDFTTIDKLPELDRFALHKFYAANVTNSRDLPLLPGQEKDSH